MSSSTRIAGLERREVLIELVLQYPIADCSLKSFLRNDENLKKAARTQTRNAVTRRQVDGLRKDVSNHQMTTIFSQAKEKFGDSANGRMVEAKVRSKIDLPKKAFEQILSQKSYPGVVLVPPKQTQKVYRFGKEAAVTEMSFFEVDDRMEPKEQILIAWLMAVQFSIHRSDPSLYEQLVVNGTERFKGIADALIESRGKPTADLMEEITIIAQEIRQGSSSLEEVMQETFASVHSVLAKYSKSACEWTVNHIRHIPTAVPYPDFETLAHGTVTYDDTKHCAECHQREHFKTILELPREGFLVEGHESSLFVDLKQSLNCFFPPQLVIGKVKFHRTFSVLQELNRDLTTKKVIFVVDSTGGELLTPKDGKLTHMKQCPQAAGYQIAFVMYSSMKPPPETNMQPNPSPQGIRNNLVVVEWKFSEHVPTVRPMRSRELMINGQKAKKHQNLIPAWGTQSEPVPVCWLNYLLQVVQHFARNERLDVCWTLYRRMTSPIARDLCKAIVSRAGQPSEKSEELRHLAVHEYVDQIKADTNLCFRLLWRTRTLLSVYRECKQSHQTYPRKPNQLNLDLDLFHPLIGLRHSCEAQLCGEPGCNETTKLHLQLDGSVLIIETTTNGYEKLLYLTAKALYRDFPPKVQTADGKEFFLHFLSMTEYYLADENEDTNQLIHHSPHGFNFEVLADQSLLRVCDGDPLIWGVPHNDEEEQHVHGYGVAVAYYVNQAPAPPKAEFVPGCTEASTRA